MQIVSGLFRGRTIKTPKGAATRPTQSRVRAAIFNSLQHCVEEASFLDICAGSGAMGFEAISRGAKQACFIEQEKNAIACIRHNIDLLHVKDQAQLFPLDAVNALKKLDQRGSCFDIIYFDPPYGKELTISVIQEIDHSQHLLTEEGVFVVEERADIDLSHLSLRSLSFLKAKEFGDAALSFFVRRRTS